MSSTSSPSSRLLPWVPVLTFLGDTWKDKSNKACFLQVAWWWCVITATVNLIKMSWYQDSWVLLRKTWPCCFRKEVRKTLEIWARTIECWELSEQFHVENNGDCGSLAYEVSEGCEDTTGSFMWIICDVWSTGTEEMAVIGKRPVSLSLPWGNRFWSAGTEESPRTNRRSKPLK